MMELKEIQVLLQRYFNGETSEQEEKQLEAYFRSENIANEVAEFSEFFKGVTELANTTNHANIDEDIMDYILEHESGEKTKFRKLWMNVTGIAASIIIVLGGFLFYQQQQKPFDDTFDTPEEAFAYAQETLQFVSGKYKTGLASLSNFEKLQKGSKELAIGVAPVNDFFNRIEKLEQNKSSEIISVDSL